MDILKCVKIRHIIGRQIFDSRGTPTVEAEVILENGIRGVAAAPSGASTGMFEACELRDNIKEDYNGKGVLKAVNNINQTIAKALGGRAIHSQQQFDEHLIKLDGTDNKTNLGANAILAVSLACAKAAANAYGLELFQYIGGINAVTMPVPMMNILNGGAHANNNIDIQEFMIMPVGAQTFFGAMKMGTEVYHSLGKVIKDRGLSTAVGDEGGYAPTLENDEQAIELIMEAIEKAGYKPGKDLKIALDAATSEWYTDNGYIFPKKNKKTSQSELIDYFKNLTEKYPIISIEDPLAEEDFDGFTKITNQIGSKIQIVGDDLFVTNPKRLQKGIDNMSANAILIKPNQIGTLSETMQAVCLAKRNGYNTILSHRSGETEDTSIADIAVGLNAGQIKTGATARTDRVCKYNRLLRIEEMLGNASQYHGEIL